MTSTNSIAIQILHNVIGNDSQWFWAMAQFFAVAITLGFIWRQIHLQRMGNTLASLAQFESRWTSPEMFEARKAICTAFRDEAPCSVQSAERVACFFEEIGLYVSKKVFGLDIVWELYSTYVEHYWPMLQPRVLDLQKGDPTVYASFQRLHAEVQKFSKQQGAPFNTFTRDQLLEFAAEELDKGSTPPLKPPSTPGGVGSHF
jgi:hypothetical protein